MSIFERILNYIVPEPELIGYVKRNSEYAGYSLSLIYFNKCSRDTLFNLSSISQLAVL